MKKIFFVVAVFVLVTGGKIYAGGSEDLYQQAHECYNNLRANADLQKHRDQWQRCINQFEHIYNKFGRTDDGERAKFSLGKLYEDLAQNSKNKADWVKALKEYHSFARQFPRSSMADDAYFASAKISWEKLDNREEAEKDLIKVIKFYKESDMAEAAEKYLAAMRKGVKVPFVTSSALVGANTAIVHKKKKEDKVNIVVDAGHGGDDTGAVGPDGTKEKDVTLGIARLLAKRLSKQIKDSNVSLVRDSDKTMTLHDRTKFTVKKEADIFISIHANASTSKDKTGIQTYYLNNATDEAAKRLAEQENKNLGRKTSDLDKIISTMVQNDATEDSKLLAGLVQKRLYAGLSRKYSNVKNDGVRSALFYVLVGSKAPSILVETSYISNPSEEKRLLSENYRQIVVEGISLGVEDYLKKNRNSSNL